MARNVFRSKAPAEPGPRRGRLVFVSCLLAAGFLALLARGWQLQVSRHDHFMRRSEGQYRTTFTVRASRGSIYDRTGAVLAESADQPSVCGVPRLTNDRAPALAAALAPILDADVAWLRGRLSGQRRFVYLARHVTPDQARRVEALDDPGLFLRQEPKRFYPKRALAGALLGFAGIDGAGLEGVERDFDRYLRGRDYVVEALRDARGRMALPGGALPAEQLAGHSLELTLDSFIQQLAETELIKQVEAMDAKSGVVVVLDARTGDVLAMAQTPAFDPNEFQHHQSADWRNRIITDVLEPGSTAKPLLIAGALDAGKVRPDTLWDGHHGHIRVGRKTIHDVHGVDKMTTLEIIQHSSNVGAVQVAQRLGKEAYYHYLRGFGFGQPTELGLRGEQVGSLRPAKRWGIIHLATFAYGYGFSVTPLQMALAVGALANGGVLMRPRLVRAVLDARGGVVERFPVQERRRVVSARAAREVTEGMIMVTHKGGTGTRARVPGYEVAGKTGTAHKVDPLLHGYSKKKVRASFAGFVPARAPRLVIYVNVDEPRKGRYGGVVAGPVFSRIAREALPYLGVKATEAYVAEDEELVDDWEAPAPAVDPQARPWWFEEAVLVGAPKHLVVPDLKGQSLAAVVRHASALALRLRVQGAGVVVSQRPQAGALLPPDSTVAVVLDLPGRPPRAAAERGAAQ